MNIRAHLAIRVAGQTDVTSVLQLLGKCLVAMRQAGIDQWDDVYPNPDTILSDVKNGNMFLGLLDEAIVAAVVLDHHQNPEYLNVPWAISGGRVAVVHRLMVDPSVQGCGIARELMRMVEHRARTCGYSAIRLDAFSENPRALRLYHGLDYRDAGTVAFRKGVFRCFEKGLDEPACCGSHELAAFGTLQPRRSSQPRNERDEHCRVARVSEAGGADLSASLAARSINEGCSTMPSRARSIDAQS